MFFCRNFAFLESPRPRPLYDAGSMSSPADETQRLAQRYSQMTDGELQEISADQVDLTESGRSALLAELQRRGLSEKAPSPPPGYDEIEFRDLVTARLFRGLSEALIAKGSLDSAGIESFLVDDNMGRIFVPTFTGGVRLQVRREDLEAVNQILNEPAPESFESADEESADQ